eukprot:gene11910-15934_t
MENLSQRTDAILSTIQMFREEQEHILLNTSESAPITTYPSPYPLPHENLENNGVIDQSAMAISIGKILNCECIVMPVLSNKNDGKVWPKALIANQTTNFAQLEMIESKGSLWKLIQRKDSNPGYRVLLQTAELGESVRYLNGDLELVDLKGDAALWDLIVIEQNNERISKRQPEFGSDNETCPGLIVQLECLSPSISATDQEMREFTSLSYQNGISTLFPENNDNNDNKKSPIKAPRSIPNPVLLSYNMNLNTAFGSNNNNNNNNNVSRSKLNISLSDYSLGLFPVQDMINNDGFVIAPNVSNASNSLKRFSNNDAQSKKNTSQTRVSTFWEIVPESWISNELDFLEEFIS